MGALGPNVFDLLTLEPDAATPNLDKISLDLRPITGCCMKTHSVLVSASTLGTCLTGNISES